MGLQLQLLVESFTVTISITSDRRGFVIYLFILFLLLCVVYFLFASTDIESDTILMLLRIGSPVKFGIAEKIGKER